LWDSMPAFLWHWHSHECHDHQIDFWWLIAAFPIMSIAIHDLEIIKAKPQSAIETTKTTRMLTHSIQFLFLSIEYVIYILVALFNQFFMVGTSPSKEVPAVHWLAKSVPQKYCGSNNTIIFSVCYYCVTTGITNALLPALVPALLTHYYHGSLTLGVTPSNTK